MGEEQGSRGERASGAVREDPCYICGQDECTCYDLRAPFAALAEDARKSGFAAALSGRVWQAQGDLRSAVELDSTDARAWAVLGLCSFALGDLPQARACWNSALNQDGHSPASSWLRTLASGPVRDALEAYNTALGDAQGGRWTQARNSLEAVRRILPDFVPAGLLLGLVLEADGRLPEARSVWIDLRSHARDHPELLRLLAERAQTSRPSVAGMRRWYYPASAAAAVVAAVALLALLRPQPEPGSADTQDAPPVPQAEQSPPIPTQAGGAATPLVLEGPPSTTEPDPAVTAVQYDVAWDLFEQARGQAEAGDWVSAVPRLTLVAEWAGGRFYHDDALYMLARGYAHNGMSDQAKVAASTLLATYPTSIFANSVSRNIARTGRQP